MKTVAQNRRARFDFQITETIEAGIRLTGPEVKSCRASQISLAGAYVSFLGGIPMLKQMKISPYANARKELQMEPARDRELLLKASELKRLEAMQSEKGISIVPIEVRAGRFVKVVLGIGRGRKRLDKRERIKERSIERRLRTHGSD
ncbi:MAG: SsrA-binding protein SmpB [Candidatus Peribacteraceae bacterium]